MTAHDPFIDAKTQVNGRAMAHSMVLRDEDGRISVLNYEPAMPGGASRDSRAIVKFTVEEAQTLASVLLDVIDQAMAQED